MLEQKDKKNTFEFKNVTVRFPFSIYSIQENYMRQMIRALDEVSLSFKISLS